LSWIWMRHSFMTKPHFMTQTHPYRVAKTHRIP